MVSYKIISTKLQREKGQFLKIFILIKNIQYLKRMRLSSLEPPGKARIVMYTPGSSSSIHSVSKSLALLTERSSDWSPSLVLTEPSTDDVSVFASFVVEGLMDEAKPPKS